MQSHSYQEPAGLDTLHFNLDHNINRKLTLDRMINRNPPSVTRPKPTQSLTHAIHSRRGARALMFYRLLLSDCTMTLPLPSSHQTILVSEPSPYLHSMN